MEKKIRKPQVPGYFRYILGNYEITSLYDGYIPGYIGMYYGQEPEKTKNVWINEFSNTFISDNKFCVKADCNTFLIDTGEELVLIDTGGGNFAEPTLGKMMSNMLQSGYSPEDVDKILITHAHPDHVGGLVLSGEMTYPNATVYINKKDYDVWVGIIPNFKNLFEPYIEKRQCVFFNEGDPITYGITAIPLPGHTVGHTGYEVVSEDKKILIWGDIIHDADVQFSNMDVEVVVVTFDEKRIAQEIDMAKDVVKKVAQTKTLVAGMHLPFPGIGHVVENKEGTGYRFIPVHYNEVE